MATAFSVETDSKRLLARIKNIQIKLPEEVGTSTYDMAKHAQRMLRRQLTKNGNVWSGKTWKSIRAKKVNKQKSIVTIRKQGIWLDSAKPHYVALRRGRNITKWANSKGIKAKVLYVKPHPFIDDGLARASINYQKMIRRRVKKALENSK